MKKATATLLTNKLGKKFRDWRQIAVIRILATDALVVGCSEWVTGFHSCNSLVLSNRVAS
jgi:hypothetical protein